MLSSVRRSIWHTGTRRVGRGVLVKALDYYKLNYNDRNDILRAYNKYINALNNTSNKLARNNARQASTIFVNTMFKIYEKKTRRSGGAISNGISNGVQSSLMYWLPGVMLRKAIRPVRKYKSAPIPTRRRMN